MSPSAAPPSRKTARASAASRGASAEGNSTGEELKSALLSSGKASTTKPPRVCTKHESPSAATRQRQAAPCPSNFTPTKAANEPARRFSSAYQGSDNAPQPACSRSPRAAAHARNSSAETGGDDERTHSAARSLAHFPASKASVAPSATA